MPHEPSQFQSTRRQRRHEAIYPSSVIRMSTFTFIKEEKYQTNNVNRMQIVETGGCGFRYEQGGYFVLIVTNTKACKVRLYVWDFAGRIVAHCHKLKQEDCEMMVWV
jgi:hypothetical protein